MNQDVSINVVLQVGDVSDPVTVTAEAPLLESSTSSVGKAVENREIVNLPLNSPNPRQLVFLTPGVSGRDLIVANYWREARMPFEQVEAVDPVW